eukprot:TRINITY_DN400_c0_g1_i2.p1 TRINITY_DN400_c0_g1~~TRINITY_DN400_c0_g1_i2.p1  ORF type:complete len:273 (+),score=14.68 TRINITY_DN400_c0_g1_i2:292-1110(+)
MFLKYANSQYRRFQYLLCERETNLSISPHPLVILNRFPHFYLKTQNFPTFGFAVFYFSDPPVQTRWETKAANGRWRAVRPAAANRTRPGGRSAGVTRYITYIDTELPTRARFVWTWLHECNSTDQTSCRVPITVVFDYTNNPHIFQAWIFLDLFQYEIWVSNMTSPVELYCEAPPAAQPKVAPVSSPSTADLQPLSLGQSSPVELSGSPQEFVSPASSPSGNSAGPHAPASVSPKSSGRTNNIPSSTSWRSSFNVCLNVSVICVVAVVSFLA